MAIAVPVIVVDTVLWVALRRVFRHDPERVRWVDTYVPWATVLIALIFFTVVAWPLAIAFALVVAVFAAFGSRMGLPFGFPIYSGLRRRPD